MWKVIDQLCRRFGEVQTFLDDNGDVAPKTMDHIRVIFNDEERRKELQLEMAAVVDAGQQHFVRAAYSLKGDGPLVFSAFQKLHSAALSEHTCCRKKACPGESSLATR